MQQFIINENDSSQRIDKFISKVFPKLPKSLMYKLIRKKDVKINGKRCEISTRLCCGDIVTIYLNEKINRCTKKTLFIDTIGEIDIVYEDSNILIVNKPVGLTVHCDNNHDNNTLINQIKSYLYSTGSYNPEYENSFVPALCSRLDKNTCGLVTAAKNATSLRAVNEAIRNGKVQKVYHCISVGTLPKYSDILNAYHFKEFKGNIVKISDTPKKDYKPIKTGYKVIRSNSELSLLEVTLFTGRTHQIRAHLSHIGAPILGDGKYGNVSINKKYRIYDQALCAVKISFCFDNKSPLGYLNGRIFTAPAPEFERLI